MPHDAAHRRAYRRKRPHRPTHCVGRRPPPADSTDGLGPASLIAGFVAAGFDTSHTRSWLVAISIYEREGHLMVPPGHRELSMDLYMAIHRVRARYRATKLTPDQVAAWESIGMIWVRRTVLTQEQRAEIVRLYDPDKPKPSIRDLAVDLGDGGRGGFADAQA